MKIEINSNDHKISNNKLTYYFNGQFCKGSAHG